MTIIAKLIRRLPFLFAGGYFAIATVILFAACFTKHDGGPWLIHVYLSVPLSFVVSRLAEEIMPMDFLYGWPSQDFPLISWLMIFSTMVLGPIMYYYVGKGLRLLLMRNVAAREPAHD